MRDALEVLLDTLHALKEDGLERVVADDASLAQLHAAVKAMGLSAAATAPVRNEAPKAAPRPSPAPAATFPSASAPATPARPPAQSFP